MVNPQIQTDGLALWFGKTQVLNEISLAVPARQVTAVIGPSGCGKSTLLRCFNRMNDLISGTRIAGRVTLSQRDIYAPRTDVTELRSQVGMVFQKPNPFPKSIFQNVAYGLQVQGKLAKGEIAERVEASLRAAWLWDEVKNRLHSPAMSLSGGQQQRLCIARALATRPQVLLLDEPTSALDPQSTAKIEELCLALKDEVTILIVTHNVAQAGRISDFAAFMYLGELVEFDATARMFTVPSDKRTEAYLTGVFG